MSQLDDQTRRRGPSLGTKVSDILPEQVDEALHDLRAEVMKLIGMEGAGSALKVARVQAWSEAIRGPLLPLLREAWRTREADLEQVLVEAKAIPGLESAVVAFRKGLRAHAKAAAAGLRVVEGDVDARRVQTFTIDGEPVTVHIPDNYACDATGVYQIRRRAGPDGAVLEELVRVSHGPILLTRCFAEPGGGLAEYVELAWTRPGHRWKRKRVSRGVITSARDLYAQGVDGLPVTSETAGRAVGWLAALEAANELTPGWVSSRMGWQGERYTHFLWGRRLIAPEASEVEIELLDDDDAGLHATAKGLRERGTWAGWLQALKGVADRPLAWAAVYASCASPLLGVLGCPSFVVDFHAVHGAGKSTALRLAGSVWGDASESGGLTRSWSMTEAGAEAYAESMQSLPLLVDESNNVAERDRPSLATRIYMLANGVGKLRGAVKGSRRTRSWRTVTISTGEQSLKSFTQDGGVHGRVVSLYGAPMGSAAQAQALTWGIGQHHGHLGPRLVQLLVGMDKAARATLADDYRLALDELGAMMTTDTGRRVAQYLAAMRVAADLVHDRLGVPRPAVDPMPAIVRLADEGASQGKKHEEALRQVLGAALAKSAYICHGRAEDGPRTPATGAGWIGRFSDAGPGWSWLALHKDFVRCELKSRGFDWAAITTQWRESGLLQVRGNDPKRQVTMPTAMPGDVPGARPEMVRFTRKALFDLGVYGLAADGE